MALAVTAAASLAVGFGALIVAIVVDSTSDQGGFSLEQSRAGQFVDPETSLVASSLLRARASSTGVATSLVTGAVTAPTTSTTAVPTTTTTVLLTTTTSAAPLTTSTVPGEEAETAEAQSAQQPIAAPNGLFTAPSERARRLAGFLVFDDTIFTSASAIDGFDEVSALVDGEWIPAIVVARDLVNDLAVLEVSEDDLRAKILTDHEAVWAALEDPQKAAQGSAIMLSIDGEDSVEGFIVDDDHRAVANSGISIYGTLLTSAPKPQGASGAALTDQAGALIGLVVDSTEHMASVVPVDTIASIGQSLRQWGVPAIEWLGIKGSSLPNGGVQLDQVATDGPAFLANLYPGDVISKVNGVPIRDWDHLVHLVRRSGAGSTITVVVERNSIERHVEATVGSKHDYPDAELTGPAIGQ